MMRDDRYKFIVSYVEGMALDAVWLYLQDDVPEYFERRSLFLLLLGRMLDEGRIVAGKNGVCLSNSSGEIVDLFECSLPEREEDIDDGVWFFSEACPAGIGWVGRDGNVYWA